MKIYRSVILVLLALNVNAAVSNIENIGLPVDISEAGSIAWVGDGIISLNGGVATYWRYNSDAFVLIDRIDLGTEIVAKGVLGKRVFVMEQNAKNSDYVYGKNNIPGDFSLLVVGSKIKIDEDIIDFYTETPQPRSGVFVVKLGFSQDKDFVKYKFNNRATGEVFVQLDPEYGNLPPWLAFSDLPQPVNNTIVLWLRKNELYATDVLTNALLWRATLGCDRQICERFAVNVDVDAALVVCEDATINIVSQLQSKPRVFRDILGGTIKLDKNFVKIYNKGIGLPIISGNGWYLGVEMLDNNNENIKKGCLNIQIKDQDIRVDLIRLAENRCVKEYGMLKGKDKCDVLIGRSDYVLAPDNGKWIYSPLQFIKLSIK